MRPSLSICSSSLRPACLRQTKLQSVRSRRFGELGFASEAALPPASAESFAQANIGPTLPLPPPPPPPPPPLTQRIKASYTDVQPERKQSQEAEHQPTADGFEGKALHAAIHQADGLVSSGQNQLAEHELEVAFGQVSPQLVSDLLRSWESLPVRKSLKALVMTVLRRRIQRWDPESMHAEDLVCAVSIGGVSALNRLWPRVEAVQEEGGFSLEQIATLFTLCSRLVLDPPAGQLSKKPFTGEEEFEPPLSAKVVQLFSEHVCSKLEELTPQQITDFVLALTSPALPMDEFWLFMLAKRTEDTASDFNAQSIVEIARRYSIRNLEDDQFFTALAKRVAAKPSDFTLWQLADFLLSCAKLRFLDTSLCELVLPLFEDAARLQEASSSAVTAAIAAAAVLDQQYFDPRLACRVLAQQSASSGHQRHDKDLDFHLVTAAACLGNPSCVRTIVAVLHRWHSGTAAEWKTESALSRRIALLGLCASVGIPRASAWTLPTLRLMNGMLPVRSNRRGNAFYEPASSTFHLEVSAALRVLQVDHKLEKRHAPFYMDIVISPQ